VRGHVLLLHVTYQLQARDLWRRVRSGFTAVNPESSFPHAFATMRTAVLIL